MPFNMHSCVFPIRCRASPAFTSVVCCPSAPQLQLQLFRRTTMGLRLLGCTLLFVHWTMIYEDFIVLDEASSTRHCDLRQTLITLLELWGVKFASSPRVPSSSISLRNVKPH